MIRRIFPRKLIFKETPPVDEIVVFVSVSVSAVVWSASPKAAASISAVTSVSLLAAFLAVPRPWKLAMMVKCFISVYVN